MSGFRKHLEKQLEDPNFVFEYEKQSSEREYIRALASARIEQNMTQAERNGNPRVGKNSDSFHERRFSK